ncbi:hypothetical protein FKP32DRAFT_1558137, partial [Trametes sanguinea]
WLREAYDYMDGKQLGSDFTHALEWWAVLERGYNFDTSTRGLPSKYRPPQVANWMRINWRELEKPPHIPDMDQYRESWWLWWSGIQPAWRTKDSAGHPEIGGNGDWDCLEKPGKNGILIVLLSLVWWKQQSPAASVGDWEAAVRDVCWVIRSMAQALLASQDNDDNDLRYVFQSVPFH